MWTQINLQGQQDWGAGGGARSWRRGLGKPPGWWVCSPPVLMVSRLLTYVKTYQILPIKYMHMNSIKLLNTYGLSKWLCVICSCQDNHTTLLLFRATRGLCWWGQRVSDLGHCTVWYPMCRSMGRSTLILCRLVYVQYISSMRKLLCLARRWRYLLPLSGKQALCSGWESRACLVSGTQHALSHHLLAPIYPFHYLFV